MNEDIVNEVVIEWMRHDKYCTITAYNGSKLKNKIVKLSKSNPKEVTIEIENPDGSIVAHVPVRYIKVSKPREVSEEQRQAMSERMSKK